MSEELDFESVLESRDENLLIASYLSEEGFSDSGPHVKGDKLYNDLIGHYHSGILTASPIRAALEASVEELVERDLVNEKTDRQNTGSEAYEVNFYRLTQEGEEAYQNISESVDEELEAAYTA